MQEFWKILQYALIGYLAFCFILFIFQRRFLYFPSQIRLSEAAAEKKGLQHWPSYDGYRGFINPEGLSDPEGTVIVFHGNAGTAFDRSFYAKALSMRKWRVILAEYPGYGGRDGKPGEQVMVADALETISLAYKAFGGPLYLWGESLGCGVVSSAISQTDTPIRGVVLLLPWDTLPRVAQAHYWYLPARWLVRDQYDNINNLQGYGGRVAVLLAGKDEVIPVKHGKHLYTALAAEKKLWIFEGAGHNDVPAAPHLDWWQEVVDFISSDH